MSDPDARELFNERQDLDRYAQYLALFKGL